MWLLSDVMSVDCSRDSWEHVSVVSVELDLARLYFVQVNGCRCDLEEGNWYTIVKQGSMLEECKARSEHRQISMTASAQSMASREVR